MEAKNDNKGDIKKIQSKYILDQIFSILWENNKLKLLSYNKELQEKLNINLENYKKTYKIDRKIEINGKGCEYFKNPNFLIFEGEYKNGLKNGKGKEYYISSQNLKFEGEYIKGKKFNGQGYDDEGNKSWVIENGKKKEYFFNGKLQFEGEYINEKRWKGKGYNYEGKEEFEIKYGQGNVKEYNYNGELIYEGEYLNGMRNGKGKEYNNNSFEMFEGEYLNGKRIKGKGYNIYGQIVLNIQNGKKKNIIAMASTYNLMENI